MFPRVSKPSHLNILSQYQSHFYFKSFLLYGHHFNKRLYIVYYSPPAKQVSSQDKAESRLSCVITGPGHMYYLFSSTTHTSDLHILHLCNMVKLLRSENVPHIPDTAKPTCTQLSPDSEPSIWEVPAHRNPATVPA